MIFNRARIIPVILHSFLVLFSFTLLQNAVVVSAQAQSLQVHTPKPKPRIAAPGQPFNSMAKSTTPFNCDQYRSHPFPDMVRICQGMENDMIRGEARQQGRPAASSSVYRLPALGTPEAKQSGFACVGGQAMHKLPNGWEQVIGEDGWQRCTGG